MQRQKSEPDDVGLRLFERWKVQERRQSLLQRLFLQQLFHLWLLITE